MRTAGEASLVPSQNPLRPAQALFFLWMMYSLHTQSVQPLGETVNGGVAGLGVGVGRTVSVGKRWELSGWEEWRSAGPGLECPQVVKAMREQKCFRSFQNLEFGLSCPRFSLELGLLSLSQRTRKPR